VLYCFPIDEQKTVSTQNSQKSQRAFYTEKPFSDSNSKAEICRRYERLSIFLLGSHGQKPNQIFSLSLSNIFDGMSPLTTTGTNAALEVWQ
jgi:hypothetical protein